MLKTIKIRNMECRVFIDVDCTYAEEEDIKSPEDQALKEDILSMLQNGSEPRETFTEAQVKNVFCNLLDRWGF